MKARFYVVMIFLMVLTVACQSEEQSMPDHAHQVREKHRLNDSLRSLEIIESLQQDSSQLAPAEPIQD